MCFCRTLTLLIASTRGSKTAPRNSSSANSWDASQNQVSWKLDKVPLKSTNHTSICLLIGFLIESESSITSPLKKKTCCLKWRDVKNRTNNASAGPRIPLFIYERMSVPYKITDIGSLRRFASETWHYEFKGLWFRLYIKSWFRPYSCFYHELSVTLSMDSGILPTDLKVASVKPLLKKQSLSSDEFKNFRPISK